MLGPGTDFGSAELQGLTCTVKYSSLCQSFSHAQPSSYSAAFVLPALLSSKQLFSWGKKGEGKLELSIVMNITQTRRFSHTCRINASNTITSLVTPLLMGKCKHRIALAWLFLSEVRQLKSQLSAFSCEKSSQESRISSFSKSLGNRRKYSASLGC